MAKKERVRYDPERRLGWGRGFLKALEKAGPDIVAGVFATIDARADEFENPVFAQGVKTFAREVLDDVFESFVRHRVHPLDIHGFHEAFRFRVVVGIAAPAH